MKRILLPAVLALIVVVSFVALAGWNRSSRPRQQITLTERELPLSRSGADEGDDPGLQLRLTVQRRDDPLDARNWLTEQRLRSLGFALEVPAGAPDAAVVYRNVLPRVAWVVFEYEGEAWRQLERRQALQQDRYTGHAEQTRLVPVDAGVDVDALLAKYQQGHLILRSTIHLRYRNEMTRGPLVYGELGDVHPSSVTVPLRRRDRFAGLEGNRKIRMSLEGPLGKESPAAPTPPRYEVDLAVGPLGVPYIRDARRLP